MLLSRNWLQEFVDLKDLSSEKIASLLTLKTVEVEKVEVMGGSLENIVVGQVITIDKHPDADKLLVCLVDVGSLQVEVVCGGSNLKLGMKIAFGKLGAKIKWHGEGDLVELKKTKIRGVVSSGMICAADEIGLASMFDKKDEREILDLSHLGVQAGTLVSDALGLNDVVFEVENKSLSNRPDLWGHYGMARELGAIFEQKLKSYKTEKLKSGRGKNLFVKVEDKELCPRYTAVVIDGVRVEESPQWLQKRLIAVGQRPINNIVDITNYVMFELGQPTHAFDAENVVDNTIIVRRAHDKEKFVTLDGQERKLDKSMLVIADKEKSLAIAGVMGGSNSDISNKTKTIIFESANFEPISVRKTATKLGIRTEASMRWEKSQDPNNADIGLSRLVELTLKLCPDAKVVSSVVDIKNFKIDQEPIEMTFEYVNQKIGSEIFEVEVIKILERLGFVVKQKHGRIIVTVPTWRATKDISIKEDLIEEIVRIYGYEKISGKMPLFSITSPQENTLRKLERKVKELLAYRFGFTEVYNYSFVASDLLTQMGEETKKHLVLDNPMAKDRSLIRRSLIPNLLVSAEANLHRYSKIRIFEIGRIYIAEEKGEEPGLLGVCLPKQDSMLGLIFSGKEDRAPFFSVTNALTEVFSSLGLSWEIKKSKTQEVLVHPGRSAEIYVQGVRVGKVGELHPHKQEKLGISHKLAMAEINLNSLVELIHDSSNYKSLAVYPSIERDLAFLVANSVEHATIINAIKHVDRVLEGVELFDVYMGKNIGEGKKSMAYHLIYRSDSKTLESSEIDVVHNKVITLLQEKFGAEIRT